MGTRIDVLVLPHTLAEVVAPDSVQKVPSKERCVMQERIRAILCYPQPASQYRLHSQGPVARELRD